MSEAFERAALGATLLNSANWPEVAVLGEDDFSLDAHRRIFSRMRGLTDLGDPIEILALAAALDQNNELEAIGGMPYLGKLIDGVIPERIAYYVAGIQESSQRRRFRKNAEQAERIATDLTVNATALAEAAQTLCQIAVSKDPLPPRFSEEALALRFSRRYADDLRFVSRWGNWMRWDGLRWVVDDTLHVFDLARGICRAASAEVGNSREAAGARLASKATTAAVERLAAADRRHAATTGQWDTDPWLLNTPIGTVDLHTGELHEHQRSHFITKMAMCGPGGDCPLWLRFLDHVTGDDSELVSFLQRMTGYALTGCCDEHALFFLYGPGANGKSVFLSTVSGLLADYAKIAPASSFTASMSEQHPTDLAGLRGARLVTASETEEGTRWAETKIKSLTGGERIAARFMRGDFFEFLPEFKLVIAGNHKPSLRSVDEAIRRRLHLIPFTVIIPHDQRDPKLGEKLRAEFPGILNWAIQGCLAWQREGLNAPAVIRGATADYLAAEDVVGRWLDDRCILNTGCWTAGATLLSDYQAWAEQTGERAMSQRRLAQALEGRGFVPLRTRAARGFTGIGLRRDVTHVTDPPVIAVTHVRGRPISGEVSQVSRSTKQICTTGIHETARPEWVSLKARG